MEVQCADGDMVARKRRIRLSFDIAPNRLIGHGREHHGRQDQHAQDDACDQPPAMTLRHDMILSGGVLMQSERELWCEEKRCRGGVDTDYSYRLRGCPWRMSRDPPDWLSWSISDWPAIRTRSWINERPTCNTLFCNRSRSWATSTVRSSQRARNGFHTSEIAGIAECDLGSS